ARRGAGRDPGPGTHGRRAGEAHREARTREQAAGTTAAREAVDQRSRSGGDGSGTAAIGSGAGMHGMLTRLSPSTRVAVTGPPPQSRPDAAIENVWPGGNAST